MKNKKHSWILNLMLFLFLCLFVFSAWKLYLIYDEYHSAEKSYSELDQFISDNSPKKEESSNHSEADVPAVNTDMAQGFYSDISWPEIDFSALEQINQDILAWIYIEGTEISYPVVQGSDNEYYLTHVFDGTYNSSGCIFLDANASSDFSSFNHVLYGHHMKNGKMFAGLEKYKEQSYYDEHPLGLLITPTQRYVVEFFSGYVANPNGISWNDDFTDEEFQQWLKEISQQSCFESDILPTWNDHILTLSTCSYEYDNARYVLHGILVPSEE